MKAKIKQDLNKIVGKTVGKYTEEDAVLDTSKLGDLIKQVNLIKDVETQELDNKIKLQKVELEVQKHDLEKSRLILDQSKLDLEIEKLEFEKGKFDIELKKSKSDKIFNGVMKGLEIGVPLVAYVGLSLVSLKLVYKDDGIVPSPMKDFISHILKKR